MITKKKGHRLSTLQMAQRSWRQRRFILHGAASQLERLALDLDSKQTYLDLLPYLTKLDQINDETFRLIGGNLKEI
ncbi:MAG: hypothetical protein UT69_C0037G0003 [Candidatus Yanofskybacteria bacterium GW2011_GWE1_40_10]|nr:MAG: hypothetical protein UT69_C0037G0003 [Candidatus Yanofskybacteria bacterium GW2011_GWE1_40_10]